ncbi:hypothetical protein FISHEDRAFT_77007 [Fistulina hepatica ATCC 64428]|uniref:Uncharacterized protein n=1 Tax=Fistulina hepatica ATCC 64428 TaxID=1128425 RepID=A0A0D7A4Z1_9AGAR|nr:hypothetical protein FISHEDRAFT_77007 [Fistulina hepatica ATCC 64428]
MLESTASGLQALSHGQVLYPDLYQVIELVECPPPPPRIATGNSVYSSSLYTSESESSVSDDDEAVSSYCSSDTPVTPVELVSSCSGGGGWPGSKEQVFLNVKPSNLSRILLWRQQSLLCSSEPTTVKPRVSQREGRSDGVESNARRMRSEGTCSDLGRGNDALTSVFSCPACDVTFPDRESLRQHGEDTSTSPPCASAVQYALE